MQAVAVAHCMTLELARLDQRLMVEVGVAMLPTLLVVMVLSILAAAEEAAAGQVMQATAALAS